MTPEDRARDYEWPEMPEPAPRRRRCRWHDPLPLACVALMLLGGIWVLA